MLFQNLSFSIPASTSRTLPSNTVTNPKEDLKGITTRSGVAYKGPTIHTTSSPKVVERDTEVTKDTMHPTNNESTEDIPPPVVPIVHHESISEPVNAPVSASRPNRKKHAKCQYSLQETERCTQVGDGRWTGEADLNQEGLEEIHLGLKL
ncbi:hypothetical protein Tco_0319830 [Tanacetum coccineum]